MSDCPPNDELDCNCQKPGTNVPENLPGQDAIAYRIGTQRSFQAAMLASLSLNPALEGLTVREPPDATIALIDAWAAALDVLTFYQERIANEGYLRTALERRSVLELARSIGYELKPGTAASTYLAFTLERVPNSPDNIMIEAGAQVQSIPGPKESPQTFETFEKIEACVAWNSLRPRLTRPQEIQLVVSAPSQTELYVKGTQLQLQPGDAILIVGDEMAGHPTEENWDLRFLEKAEPLPDKGFTRLTWSEGLGHVVDSKVTQPALKNPKAYVFRLRAGLFGNRAPDWKTLPLDVQKTYYKYANSSLPTDDDYGDVWPKGIFCIQPNATADVDLDGAYPKIVPDSWIALLTGSALDDFLPYTELYHVKNVSFGSRTDFAYTSPTTHIRFKHPVENMAKFGLLDTLVLAQPEPLDIQQMPDPDPIAKDSSSLLSDQPVEGLFPGKTLLISGLDAATGEPIAEAVTVLDTYPEDGGTRLIFSGGLKNSYLRDSVVVYGNVTLATHGETRKEVLGSGDASQASQRFKLQQYPLTYTSSGTGSGRLSSLQMRIDELLWDETPALFNLGSHDRCYTVRIADDASVSIQFGDGICGARLPSGSENISAVYRTGLGISGMVRSNQLQLLVTRPLGVKAVTNPLPAWGADEQERLDDARRNAPCTVSTLGRVVSLQDFENFAQAFSGIGKACAAWAWNGSRRIIHLTVAGLNGTAVDGKTINLLRSAILEACDPSQNFSIAGYEPGYYFNLAASLVKDRRYLQEVIAQAVLDALGQAFSFQSRRFSQPVYKSEVMACIQNVSGVSGVQLNQLYRTNEYSQDGDLPNELPAAPAILDEWASPPVIQPAQLLILNPDPGGVRLSFVEKLA